MVGGSRSHFPSNGLESVPSCYPFHFRGQNRFQNVSLTKLVTRRSKSVLKPNLTKHDQSTHSKTHGLNYNTVFNKNYF